MTAPQPSVARGTVKFILVHTSAIKVSLTSKGEQCAMDLLIHLKYAYRALSPTFAVGCLYLKGGECFGRWIPHKMVEFNTLIQVGLSILLHGYRCVQIR